MLFVRCAFCHKLVFRPRYEKHRAKHMARRADGQMNDHITVRPQAQYQGPLDGVPQVYRHARCQGGTTMPEEIVRSYLVNPFLYGADRSFCCTCKDYFPYTELSWVETGERLDDYFRKMREDYLKAHGKPPPQPTV